MTAEGAISYIESGLWSASRPGLSRTRELLDRLGAPQKKLRFVHVAGTNGKGSACAMLASVLREAGYRTGLYTSPYILSFNERMQVDGKSISDSELIRLTELIRPLADAMDDHPSQFEIVTAMAMQFFLDEGCDIVVLETGLGGTLDSTNVIDAPELAVITNIGLEHTEYLGDTLAQIASAKAGIIKKGCTAVCYRGVPEVEKVFEDTCRARGVKLIKADFDSIRPTSQSLEGQCFSWREYEELSLPLLGEHQLRNAAVVLECVGALREKGWDIGSDSVRRGLARTVWPARLEVLSKEPLFIVDGAHNPQCAQALEKALSGLLSGKKPDFIIGVLADKDYEKMLGTLKEHMGRALCVTPASERALPGESLAEIIRGMGIDAAACDSIEAAVETVLKEGRDCVACGSLYMAGIVRQAFFTAKRREIRKSRIAARNALPESEREAKSLEISRRIEQCDMYKSARTVMLYRAMPGEVELRLNGRDKRFVYPRCTGEGQMKVYAPKSADDWERGAYGITEPKAIEENLVDPRDIDLVICPCTGFDEKGWRLGMGKGYYDRFLPQCENAHIIAAAFDLQRADSVYPVDWDIRMEAVFTEERQYTAE